MNNTTQKDISKNINFLISTQFASILREKTRNVGNQMLHYYISIRVKIFDRYM